MYRPIMNERTARFEWLIRLIPSGKTDAVSMTDLSRLTGLRSYVLRQHVLNARKNGVLICSGDCGYYFPANADELKEYWNKRRKYIKTAMIALKPFDDMFIKHEEGDPL